MGEDQDAPPDVEIGRWILCGHGPRHKPRAASSAKRTTALHPTGPFGLGSASAGSRRLLPFPVQRWTLELWKRAAIRLRSRRSPDRLHPASVPEALGSATRPGSAYPLAISPRERRSRYSADPPFQRRRFRESTCRVLGLLCRLHSARWRPHLQQSVERRRPCSACRRDHSHP